MKYKVKRFKSLAVALKELEPFIRNGEHLQTGKPFKSFGDMRSREVLANWLLCAVANAADDRNLTFSSDPVGGDGIIVDQITGETYPTEHVMVPALRTGNAGDAEAMILSAIERKHSRGIAYAAGKTLVVFLNAGAGVWHPNSVARKLPAPQHFDTVWVVSFQMLRSDGSYLYAVTNLDLSGGDAPTFLLCISRDFDAWEVKQVQ